MLNLYLTILHLVKSWRLLSDISRGGLTRTGLYVYMFSNPKIYASAKVSGTILHVVSAHPYITQ